MSSVLGRVFREYEYVVQVDDQKFVEEVAEDVVHEGLEGGWGIGETEGHDEGFKMTIACAESCLPFISLSNANEVVSASKVEFGEALGTAEAV